MSSLSCLGEENQFISQIEITQGRRREGGKTQEMKYVGDFRLLLFFQVESCPDLMLGADMTLDFLQFHLPPLLNEHLLTFNNKYNYFILV